MNLALVFPMATLVFFTFGVAILVFVSRVHAVRSGQMDMRYFKTMMQGQPTEQVVKVGRHFINLFEVPVLFYVGSILAMIIPIQGNLILFLTWGFVVARIVQAFIHIGPNKVRARALAFATGVAFATALWVDIVVAVLQRS